MTKKINVTGKPARRIEVAGRPQRRIDPDQFAAALGAEPCGETHATNLDPVALAALGHELLNRLRSSGGRPALADATEICRVPLSAEDIKTLEGMVAQIEESSGARPSVGQLVSVIVRTHLDALRALPDPATAGAAPTGEVEQPVTMTIFQKMLDEQLTPLREQVKRLESELHSGKPSER